LTRIQYQAASENQMIEIVVNGDARQVPTGTTVRALLALLEVPPERVAVELDRLIIKKSFWETTEVREGAKVEIVHFVGGG
jgi:sulfur carrier protein